MTVVALRCRGLVKRYGELTAVDGLDLEVRRGECFGLLGPNGAGKTTTVEILEGLREPDGGEVEVLGERWRGNGIALRRRIGVALQETRFPEKLTVAEVLTIFRSFYQKGLGVDEVLERVGLEEKARTWVKNLSGGQRQRLSLGTALVGDPELLFLDEPTTGLDPQARRRTWEIVEQFRAGGGTVLLTTHYMEEAERLCERVAIVDRGKVIALGTPRELISSLGAEHVVELEVAGGLTVDDLNGVAGVNGVSLDGAALRLTVAEPHRAVPTLLAYLSGRGLALERLATHHATLEDVFVGLTGRHLREE
jgi:ABC-2 type transport system ATP-binding protein